MKRRSRIALITQIFGVLLSLVVLVPAYFVVVNSLKTGPDAALLNLRLPSVFSALHNYREAYLQGYLLRALKNSLLLTMSSTILIIVVSSMAAFVIQRRRARFSRFWWNLIILGLIMPPSMVTTTVLCREIGLISLPGVSLVFVATQFPLAVFIYRGFMGSLPREIDEAAIIDGCNVGQLFFRIIFPMSLPVNMTVFVLSFLEIWNNFSITFYFLSSAKDYVMSLTVYFFFGQHVSSWNLVFADVVMIAVPVVIVYAIAQRYIVEGIVAGSVKG